MLVIGAKRGYEAMHTGSRDGNRASHGLDLIGVHETWMCHVPDINTLPTGQEARDIFGTET